MTIAHLSDAELMSVSVGNPEGAGFVEHIASCTRCRDRQNLLEQDATALRQRLGYVRTQQRVEALGRQWSWRRGLWAGAAAAVAASVVLAVRVSPRSEEIGVRFKGSAQLQLVRAPGTEGPVKENDRVFLRVATAGHPFALVLAVDDAGTVSPLWPPRSSVSGRVELQNGIALLEPGFDVTPGSFTLHAFFSDAPLSQDAATAALRRAWAERRPGTHALTPALVDGERIHAQLFVEVPATGTVGPR